MGWYCTDHKMFLFNIFQNGHNDTHLMRLKTLEKECGPLCNLEKPILGGKESFIGRVEAKVIGGQLTNNPKLGGNVVPEICYLVL